MIKSYKSRFEYQSEKLSDTDNEDIRDSYEDEFYNYLPNRNDLKYKEIENFKPYEFTKCIAHEMAIRNKDARKIIFRLNKITQLKDKLARKHKYYYLLGNKKPYILSNNIVTDILVKKLREKYLLYPHDYKIKELEYISSDSYYSYNRHVSDKNSEILLEYILSPLYSISEREEYGFKISQVLNKENRSFEINVLQPDFKRKIYDTNQINVLLNLSLPKKEILAYIEHILDTLQPNVLDLSQPPHKSPLMRKLLGKPLKTPIELLIGELENTEQTQNFPKIPVAEQMANLFFVYDYITARIQNIKSSNDKEKIECEKKIENINSNFYYTCKEKKEQIKNAKQEYNENLVDICVADIVKEENLIKNPKIKSTMITKYYYAIKPYIDNCKYKELLTGVKMV